MEIISESKLFGGRQLRVRHASDTVKCSMVFSLFLPPQAGGATEAKVPLLTWLSGLTCTDENFTTKAGAQRRAAQVGMAILAPDTSPRGDGVPDDPDGAYDFGLGAGFYVNATQAPWAEHYHMADYVTCELPHLVATNFAVDLERHGISGHSMGGHGALTSFLRNRSAYRSVSAFAPICAPRQCPWGEKALSRYLGDDRTAWSAYDACELLKSADTPARLLVDQGEADTFLGEQLKPELLEEAARAGAHDLTLRRHPGYDHSYNFMATFMDDHIDHHAREMGEMGLG